MDLVCGQGVGLARKMGFLTCLCIWDEDLDGSCDYEWFKKLSSLSLYGDFIPYSRRNG